MIQVPLQFLMIFFGDQSIKVLGVDGRNYVFILLCLLQQQKWISGSIVLAHLCPVWDFGLTLLSATLDRLLVGHIYLGLTLRFSSVLFTHSPYSMSTDFPGGAGKRLGTFSFPCSHPITPSPWDKILQCMLPVGEARLASCLSNQPEICLPPEPHPFLTST